MPEKRNNENKLKKILLKKAEGYKIKETVTEYVIDEEGNRKPVKEKEQIKFVPPDINALKTLLELSGSANSYDDYSDEELMAERERLIKSLEKECLT